MALLAAPKQNYVLLGLGVVLAILFFFLSYVYFSHTANALPSYLPGHEVGNMKMHTKHGLAAAVLGLAGAALAWFSSKPKS